MLSHSAWPHRLSPSTTQILTIHTLAHAQSEESGIEPGHIATITGSLASFPPNDPDHYDTDHTDLASEPDETELRRELLRDVRFCRKYSIILWRIHQNSKFHIGAPSPQFKLQTFLCLFSIFLQQWRQFFDKVTSFCPN